jgi:NAD(P)-dependent dehydrogenase (short-subunit alcohol dehydrogenase family)
MPKLSGKTALITGGNSGIGLATARLFEQEGARVAITTGRQTAVDQFNATCKDAFAIMADAADCSHNARVMDVIAERFGKLDVLFINAGVGKAMPFELTSEQIYDLQCGVLVRGPYFTIQAALPHLNDGASIVLNSSVSNSRGTPGLSVYNAAKAAVRSLARTLAAELAFRKIRVNTVSPGTIATPIWEKTGATAERVAEIQQQRIKQIPLARIGAPAEVAAAVLFLASSESSYVTGIDLPVDGGWTQI